MIPSTTEPLQARYVSKDVIAVEIGGAGAKDEALVAD